MKNAQKILMPIDFSAVSQNAVSNASSMLAELPAEVVLVYVNTPDDEMQEQEIQDTFKRFELHTLKGVSFYYKFVVLHGNLLRELANASEKYKADAVIMGLKERISDLSLTAELMRVRNKLNGVVAV